MDSKHTHILFFGGYSQYSVSGILIFWVSNTLWSVYTNFQLINYTFLLCLGFSMILDASDWSNLTLSPNLLPRLGIEKRLLEDEEINSLSSLYRDSKRRKLDHSKYESLNETPASITAQKPLENFNSSSSTVASEQMTQCSICQQSMSTSQYIEHIQIVHGTENGTGTSDGGNKLRNVRSFFPILWRILHLKIGNLW